MDWQKRRSCCADILSYACVCSVSVSSFIILCRDTISKIFQWCKICIYRLCIRIRGKCFYKFIIQSRGFWNHWISNWIVLTFCLIIAAFNSILINWWSRSKLTVAKTSTAERRINVVMALVLIYLSSVSMMYQTYDYQLILTSLKRYVSVWMNGIGINCELL